MAEALRARDAGDLAAAQKALTHPAAMSPDDKAVQRLRSEIEAQATAQQAPAQEAAPNRPQSRRRAALPAGVGRFRRTPAVERARRPRPSRPVMVAHTGTGQSVVPSGACGRRRSRRPRPSPAIRPAQLQSSTGQMQLATARRSLRADQPGGRHRHVDAGAVCRRIRSPNSSSPTSNEKPASRAPRFNSNGATPRGPAPPLPPTIIAPDSSRTAGTERQLAQATAKPEPPSTRHSTRLHHRADRERPAQYVAGDPTCADLRAVEAGTGQHRG